MGVDPDAAIARAEDLRVSGMPVRAMALEDVVTSMLLARNELFLDYEGLLAVSRLLRERIDWEEVRARTARSPYAVGFLALAEALEVVPRAAPGRPVALGEPREATA
jgi:hypothetical protein